MTADRDSMTRNEIPYPSLGVEERSDEAPRDGRAGATPDPEVVANEAAPVPQYRLRTLEAAVHSPGSWPPASPRGIVALTWRLGGAAKGLVAGVGLEEARRETGRTQPAGCEGSRARGGYFLWMCNIRAADEPRTRKWRPAGGAGRHLGVAGAPSSDNSRAPGVQNQVLERF